MEEKRRHKRLDIDVSVQLERLDEDGVTTLKYCHVDVTDISRSGIGFNAKVPLDIHTYYDTKIQIWTKEVVDAVVEIVRRTDSEEGVYHYGAVFIGMTDTDALKALLIAALASGRSVLKGCLFSDDSRHFIDALIRLGFPVLVDEDKRKITITGFGGRIPKNEAEIDVGSAGTAARFLTALLGLSKGRYHIVSSEQMKKRPMKDLLVSLEKLGAHIEYDENEYHFPFTIGNTGEYADTVDINVDKSSQFLSALLISAIVMEKNFTINVTGTHGMAYVEMTRLMMKQFGLDVMQDKKNNSFIIPKKAAYESLDYDIEPDVSAACYFYAMSPLLHVKSKVMGVHQNSLQGDVAFLDVLADMGCTISDEADGIVCMPPKNAHIHGGSWDLSTFSDQALTLAAIAPFANAPVGIEGISHIRLQECDRINAIEENLTELGVRVEEIENGLKIYPAERIKPCKIKTYDDHRVAMSFTLPGLKAEGVEIIDPYCCRKTFENFYEVLEESVY